MNLKLFSALAGIAVLAGCATTPTGPSREAFPGRDKTFEQFQVDDASCRDYAYARIGGNEAADRANSAAVGTAVVGTAIGAAAGALIGGGHQGAGVGAGMGLIVGSAAGSGNSEGAGYSAQRRYDVAYHQCMYAKGNKVPVYGRYVQTTQPRQPTYSQPPAAAAPPPNAPPPPGVIPPANLPPESLPPPNAPPPMR
jgi:hypothetical protein